MTRTLALLGALDRLLDGDPGRAVSDLDDAYFATPDPWFLALGAIMLFLSLDYAGSVAMAERAMLAAGSSVEADPEAVLLAWGARGFAAAGQQPRIGETPRPWRSMAPGRTPTGDPLGDAAAQLGALDGRMTPEADFTRYTIAEAALLCGRLDLAAAVVTRSGPAPLFLPDAQGSPHPYFAMMVMMRARLLVFRGLVDQAADELRLLSDMRHPPIIGFMLAGTETLVRGNSAERAEVRALADRLELARPRPHDTLSVGAYLLVAFGLSAVGDVRRSARLALFAGTESLDMLSVVDRGLTLELLVASAIDEGDLDAAEAWHQRAAPLRDDPIAGSTAARINARVELFGGRPDAAVRWSERAVELATAEGRIVELVGAQGLLELARAAEIAALELRESADDGLVARDQTRGVSGELRISSRRLSPVPGSDWSGLSVRERDIALMVAEGLTNREIGVELHLSEHTVRAHVSRVLAAFGAASRFAVAARIAELFPTSPGEIPAELTPRQQAVSERISRGLGNSEIARELGVSVKTVEKHIGEIFRRWNVTSRVAIARLVRGRGER